MQSTRRRLPSHELRCFCSKQPLLALYGYSLRRGLYVHIKVYKQKRIFGEIMVTGEGSRVDITCRECLRHHVLRISGGEVSLVQKLRRGVTDETAG